MKKQRIYGDNSCGGRYVLHKYLGMTAYFYHWELGEKLETPRVFVATRSRGFDYSGEHEREHQCGVIILTKDEYENAKSFTSEQLLELWNN